MTLSKERAEELRRRNKRGIIFLSVLGGVWIALVISQFFWPPRVRLVVAEALGSELHPTTRVFAWPDRGVVVHEAFAWGSGGRASKLTVVEPDGETRSIYWHRRGVIGVTGRLVWTDAEGRPSYVLPDLTDGPEQRPFVARCVPFAHRVTVHPSGVLEVLTSDGQVVGCTGEGERVSLEPPERRPGPMLPYRIVDAGGAQRRIEYEGRVLAEGLLRPSFAEVLPGGGSYLFVDGDAFILWRAELGQYTPLRLSRLSPTGERWTSELGRPDCRVRSEPRIARFDDRLLVVGRGPHGGNCAAALRLEDGAVLWSRPLPATG